MDIHGIYQRFQQEQVDAVNPEQRTRFDAFGEIKPEPTVEGFDTWGPNDWNRTEVRNRVRVQDAEHAHALALRREANAEARVRCNKLRGIKF